ncbi:MAG: pantetheine-phosphate adenylyltransferase [Chitinophagales bacterium]
MKKIAVFPGSFDPITTGHLDIVKRALALFDEIIIAIGHNDKKQTLYSLEQRKAWLDEVFENEDKISCDVYTGLTVDYCKTKNANYILRGIRTAADFEYEKTIAHINNSLHGNIETIFILSTPELSFVSSSIVREIIKANGDVSKYVPKEIAEAIQ